METFTCPNCSSSLEGDHYRCRSCGFCATERCGIPCFAPSRKTTSSGWLSADELSAFADRVEAGSIREATNDCFVDDDYERELLSEIYGRRLDSWTVLVSQYISGKCLDVHAGFGRRAATLAMLTDSVYAVDESISKLRVLNSRRDYSNEAVVPVQASIDRLPFAKNEFNVIVADFSGERPSTLIDNVSELQRYLADDGTLLVLFDGWVRNTGLLERIGLDQRPPDEQAESVSASLKRARPRPIASELGYSKLIAFLPSLRKPRYAFDVDDQVATSWVLERAVPGLNGESPLTGIVNSETLSNVLRHCYPGYLAVITDDPRPPELDFTNPVRIAGRARSVVLELTGENPDGIFKVPNEPNHSPFTERENRIVSELRSSDDPIVDTLPEGREHATRFGAVREEMPANGTSLNDRLDGSIDAFRETLEIGFDWLVRFQLAYRGETVVRSPAKVRDDLTFEPGNIRPGDISDSMTVFSTPIHGDYMPGNIYVKDGSVDTVIDWEYGALDGNPIVDAGFLVLFVSNLTFENYREGIQAVFREETPYAEVAKECVFEYCDAVGLPLETFETYLPLVYVHRLELDWEHNSVSVYDGTMDDRLDIVKSVTDRTEFNW